MRILGITILFVLFLTTLVFSGYRDFYEPEDHIDTLLCYGVVRCDQAYESLEYVFYYYHEKGYDGHPLHVINTWVCLIHASRLSIFLLIFNN